MADGRGSCYGSGGEPDEFDHDKILWLSGLLDYGVDVSRRHAGPGHVCPGWWLT